MKAEYRELMQKPINIMSRKDAAEYLGVHVDTVKDWTQQGKIGHFLVGDRYYYRTEDVKRMVRWIPARGEQ